MENFGPDRPILRNGETDRGKLKPVAPISTIQTQSFYLHHENDSLSSTVSIHTIFARIRAQTTLSGTVHDGTGKPLPFASVALLNAGDSTLTKGTASDQQGAYAFENVRAGKYLIRATAVGYQKAHSAVLDVTTHSAEVPALALSEVTGKLAEVQVTAKKPFVEQQLDRMVVNVANSIVGSGSTALEVLEKSPGVTVDYQNERLQLRGKEGVIVQIDGKQTYLSAQDVIALLRSMSSDNIETIELITNPSAKYDAAGNSGIINIRLKKNTNVGTNGTASIAGGSGRFDRERGSLQLNHRTSKLNLFGNYSLNRGGNYWDFLLNRNQPDPSSSDASRRNIVSQTTYLTFRDLGQNAKAGLDFIAYPKTRPSASSGRASGVIIAKMGLPEPISGAPRMAPFTCKPRPIKPIA